MHTETEKTKSSALRDLSKKVGRFCGKVAKFKDRARADKEDGVAVKVVDNLVKGIDAVSDIAVKLAKAPFVKKEEAPAPVEEAIEEGAAAEEAVVEEAAVEEAEEEALAEEAAAPEEEAEEEAVAEAPEEEAAEEEEAVAEEEAPAEYTRKELQEKTKAQLIEIVEELGVLDIATWRPKNDIIDRILAEQGEKEE